MRNITITKAHKYRGSNYHQWNIDSQYGPVGAIFTFENTKTERSPYTLKLLKTEQCFRFATLKEAKEAAMNL